MVGASFKISTNHHIRGSVAWWVLEMPGLSGASSSAERQMAALVIYGLVLSRHNACVAQQPRAGLRRSPLYGRRGERLRRVLLFPVAAVAMAAMMVVSAVPTLGGYLERLAGIEEAHF